MTQPGITHASETNFETKNTVAIDKLLKIENRIPVVRTCVSRNYQESGH